MTDSLNQFLGKAATDCVNACWCGYSSEKRKAMDLHAWLYHMTPAQRRDWILHEDPTRVAAAATLDPFRGLEKGE